MQYEYGFENGFPEIMDGFADGAFMGAAGIVMGIFLIVYFLALAFSVVSYVLNAVGMYRIAKRRGIHHAWLAWLPVGCNWLLGSISDHYQYVAKQKVAKRRRILLILSLIQLGVTAVFSGGVVVAANVTGDAATIMSIALITIAYLAMLGLSIAILVYCFIAYYDLFQSSKPNYAVLFLILGVVFNVTLPFFVFACSNSDKGMPPKRSQQPPQQIPQEQPDSEPEEEEIPVVEAEIVEDPE